MGNAKCVCPLFPSGLINTVIPYNQMMPKGYLEELWLFTVGRENLREDIAVFKYLKVPIKEGLKVFSFKLENKSKKQGRKV